MFFVSQGLHILSTILRDILMHLNIVLPIFFTRFGPQQEDGGLLQKAGKETRV